MPPRAYNNETRQQQQQAELRARIARLRPRCMRKRACWPRAMPTSPPCRRLGADGVQASPGHQDAGAGLHGARGFPLERLRYIAFSHVEADECGSLAEFLAAAPQAQPVCGRVAAMVSVGDLVDVPAVAMEDGQRLSLGSHQLVWQSTPHLPHGWECGYFFDETTGTLFCGDLFTRPGTGASPSLRATSWGPARPSGHRKTTSRTAPTRPS